MHKTLNTITLGKVKKPQPKDDGDPLASVKDVFHFAQTARILI